MQVSGPGVQRVTARPDFGALGAYRLSMASGVMAAGLAAGSEVYQFRWTDTTRLCVVTRIIFDGAGSIAAFTAGVTRIDAVLARAWTAAGTGGTAATITGDNQKLRTSMGTTLLGEARVASTVALGVGTKTLDSQAIGNAVASIDTTAGGVVLPRSVLFDYDGGAAMPIVLATNEGFALRATVPATGTWTFAVTVEWSEVVSY